MVTSRDVVQALNIKLNKTSLIIYTGKNSTLKVSSTSKKVTRSKYKSSIAPYEKGLKSASLLNSYAVTDSVMKNKLLK